MKQAAHNHTPWRIRNRLNALKMRLNQVASAWTVDDYEALLAFYTRLLPKLMDAERCTIYIIEMGTEDICSIFGTGIDTAQIRPPRKGSIVGEVISTGRGLIKNDLEKSDGYHTHVDARTGYVTRNTACCPIRSITGHGFTGAIQLLNKRKGVFGRQDLAQLEEVSHYLSTSIESIMLNQEILRTSRQLKNEYERFDRGYWLDTTFIAESPPMEEVLQQVHLVSSTPVNVLVQGENGTGKELIARMIHEQSPRREGPFIAVNCAAIPENLMESEFFGYEKGAFTGAFQRRKGRFEEAGGGTLFLDEVADMPLSIQPKFLRAIQEGEGSRLGSAKVIGYDLRIICASNKDLHREVEEGRFREDLFFRLFSMEIRLPALRERQEDILPLSVAILEDVCKRFDKNIRGISPEMMRIFENHQWPGNIRQLKREIERAVVLTPDGETIGPETCSGEMLPDREHRSPADSPLKGTLPERVRRLEIQMIRRTLEQTGHNRMQTAKQLGVTRQGLYKKMKRYGL